MVEDELVKIPTETIVKVFFDTHKSCEGMSYSVRKSIDSLLSENYRNMAVSWDLSDDELKRVVSGSHGALNLVDKDVVKKKDCDYLPQTPRSTYSSEIMRTFALEKLYAALKAYNPS